MRKLFLSLLALVSTLGAWATPITALDNNVVGKVFTIRSQARGAFVYHSTYSADKVSGSNRSGYGSLDNTDKNFLFAFVQDGSNYFLYSIGAEKYCAYASDGVALQADAPAAAVSFVASTGGTKDQFPTVIAIDGSHQLNMSTDQGKGILTNWNDAADAGNMLAIEEVEGCEFNNTTLEFTDNRVSFTYQYTYDGNEITSESFSGILSGSAFPAPSVALPVVFVAPSAPAGTVAKTDDGTTKVIECGVNADVIANFPFKYYDSFESIDTWYAAEIHSNQHYYMHWTDDALAFTQTNYTVGSENYAWGFVGDPINGFKVYNKSAGKDVMLNNATPCSLTAGDNIVKVYASRTNDIAKGYFTLKFDGQNYLNYQNGALQRWSDNDQGSTWKVEKTYLGVDAEAQKAKDDALAYIGASSVLFGNPETAGTLANTAKTAIEDYTYDNTSVDAVAPAVEFYNTKVTEMCAGVDKDIVFYNPTRNNKYMVVTEAVQMSGTDAADGTSIFHVKGVSGTKQFTIQNKANGRYIANTPAASGRVQLKPEAEAGKFTIKSWGTDNKFAFICVNPTNTTHNSLHLDGSSKVVAWEANVENMASVWVIQEPASELSVEEGTTIVKNQVWNSINTLKTSMSAVAIGDGLGQYSGDEDAFNTALNAIPTSIDGLDFEAVYALNTKKNALQTAYDALSINQPAGKAFTIKGKQNSKYLSTSAVTLDTSDPDDAGVNRVQMVDEADADIYVLTADNGLVSYTAGYGFKNSEKVALPGTAINTMTFQKGNSVGYYVLRSNYDGNPYLYNRDDRTMLCSNASLAGDNTDWILTEVAALPIKMNQVGEAWYATFNAPVSVEIPAGLKAYSAVVDGDVMELTKVAENGAVLAANTPVILYSEANVTALTISAEEGNTAEGNALSGTNQKITVEANTTHVLGNKDGIGFYKYSNTTMPAFKAYLAGASEAAAFNFSFNDVETAIEAIESNNSKAEIYDIAGRRVQKAANGLYIVNGKKVMFK